MWLASGLASSAVPHPYGAELLVATECQAKVVHIGYKIYLVQALPGRKRGKIRSGLSHSSDTYSPRLDFGNHK
jgi:hypothetical protein